MGYKSLTKKLQELNFITRFNFTAINKVAIASKFAEDPVNKTDIYG